jgi:hypothetical protein
MSKLHSALSTLRPKAFSDVPLDNLNPFLSEIFSQAELIANSIPPLPGGSDFSSSTRSRSDVNGATSASEVIVSQARPPPPPPEHAELQKGWGKPLKLSAKDQATGITVFKMAGHDRHGAWFARKSVHEGLGFEKWKRAMMSEFPESLAVQGGPGEGNIRGIGGDKRLESQVVEGVGKLEGMSLDLEVFYNYEPVSDQLRNSISIICTIPRTNHTSRVHHTPSHVRQLPDRSIEDWRCYPSPLHGRFNTCEPSRGTSTQWADTRTI